MLKKLLKTPNSSLFFILFFLTFVFAINCQATVNTKINKAEEQKRVISLAPSTTETIIALGFEKSLIGISTYCLLPQSMPQDLARLGTAKFFSAEAVLELKPDLVFGIERIPPEHVPYVSVPSQSLDEVLNAFITIAKAFGQEEKGLAIYQSHKNFIAEKRAEFAKKKRKKVLFVLNTLESQNGVVNKLVAAGNDGYFSELLNILNAENAVKSTIAYPVLSFEMIYKLNPDVVVEIYPHELAHLFSVDNWKNTPINAVKNKKIFLSHNGLVPGPRFKLFLDEMVNFLN